MVGAWDLMKDLKEHVGGGGMNGPENRASLTPAMVKHERDTFNSDINSRMDTRFDEMQGMLDDYREKATQASPANEVPLNFPMR